MTSFKFLTFVAVTICVATARTVLDDHGSYYGPSSPPPPPFDLNQGEVVMKEAVLYLTPSQIKAFEASQGQNTDQKNQFTEEDILSVEAEIKRQLQRQNIYALHQSNNEKLALDYPKQPPPVVEEPVRENPLENLPQYQQKWNPIPQQEEQKYFIPSQEGHQNNHKLAESYSYIKFFTDHETVHETPKLQLFHPIPHEEHVDPELAKYLEVQKDPLHNKQYKLVPYEYKTLEVPKAEDIQEITKLTSLLEKFNSEQNAAQLNPEFPDQNKDREEQFQKELSELKYAPNFEDHKSIADAQKFQIKIEQENALSRAEAILKAPPVVVRKEVTIKRRPLPYHSKDRHHLPQRFYPESKKSIPLDISIHKSEKNSHHHVWKH